MAGLLFRKRVDFVQPLVALLIGQPDDLERAVAFKCSGGVIVDAFAGTREQARSGIAVVHDEVGIGLVALERDADHHLAERGAGQRVSAAQRLRAEQDVDAEGAALAHDAVEEQGSGLRDGIVIHEELLEFVDDEQRARNRLGAARAFISCDVLNTEFAEQVAAPLQLFVHAFEHAQRKLAVALDGDDFRVRQPLLGVALELDAFFEIDEIELHLVRAASEGEVGDDDVEKRRFAGPGFAREERVLARPFADGQKLVFGRAGAANGDAQFAGGVVGPHLGGSRRDLGERHFDAVGIDAAFADLVRQRDCEFGAGRCVENELRAGFRLLFVDEELAVFLADANAVGAQFVGRKTIGQRLPFVPVQEGEHAAARAAGGDALEPGGGSFAERGGEIRDDQEMVFLRNAPGLLVVFSDRRVLIAQIHLDHFFDVLAEFRQALFDLVALGPDAAVDEALLVVRELHQPREVFAQPHGIDDRETDLAGRGSGQQPQDRLIECSDDRFAAGFAGLEEQRAFRGKRERERGGDLRAARQGEARVFWQGSGLRGKVCGNARELCGGNE